MSHAILQPVAALMLLTLVVWVVMYARRFAYIISNKIEAQSVASPELLNAVLPEAVNRPSNNLKNLFELPLIFYAVCISLLVLQEADAWFVNMAWAYVALRAAHSAVHCSLNIVLVRFAAYALSSVVLWMMVIRFALKLM